MCLDWCAHAGRENALWLGSDLSPDLGDWWRNVCPKSPEWISSGPTSEAGCGFEFHGQDVENMAIGGIGQDTSSEVISLFLKDWEVGRVVSCHLSMDLFAKR